jgi:DNA recombination protein RmuC
MAAVLLILLLGVGLAAALVWLARTLRDLRADWSTQLSDRNAEVDRHLIGVTETMDRRLSELDTKVDRRLENASQTTNKIHERLGKVDEATTQMLERAKDLARLEQALRPPKARGGFGELLLENLLRDRLPPSAYEMQYTFDSGERVDAIDRADRTSPVDRSSQSITTSGSPRPRRTIERQLQRQFGRDVKQHIDVAAKYTSGRMRHHDAFASPSKGSELALRQDRSVTAYAHDRRVFPVSPTTFTAYLQ